MKNVIILLIAIFASNQAYTQTFQKEILESSGLRIEEIQFSANEEISILSSSQDGVYLTYLDIDGNMTGHLMICDEKPPSASLGNKLNLHKLKKFDNGDLLIVLLTESGMIVIKINSNRDIVLSKRLPIAHEASALTLDGGAFVVVSSTVEGNVIIRRFEIDGSIISQKKIVELFPITDERRLDIAGNNDTFFVSMIMSELNSLNPHLISFDDSLNILYCRSLNESNANIEVDSQNNLIVKAFPKLGKFDQFLTPIWANTFPNWKVDNDYFYISNDNSIICVGPGTANELDIGLSTYKFTSDGNLVYARRLLDGYPKSFTGIYKIDENILVTNLSSEGLVVIRMLNAQSEATDCGSIDMCYDFHTDPWIGSSMKELNSIDESIDISEDYSCTPQDLTMELMHVCTPIEEPHATFSVVDDTLCHDEIIELIDSTVYQYGSHNWTLIDSNDLVAYSSTDRVPNNINGLVRGSYQLVHSVTFAFCEYMDSTYIYVNTKPFVELPRDTVVCDESYELFFIGDNYTSYQWNTESDTKSIEITESGQYEIVATNECGMDSDAIVIEFIDCEEGVFLPNIIAANSSSQYDFEIYHKGIIELEYIIYDRWGNLIHRAEMPNLSWSLSDINRYSKGVYVVYIKYTTEKGVNKYLVKDLTII